MFKFYVITTLISAFIVFVYSEAIAQELKREGFEKDKSETTAVEKVQKMIPLFIPILNMVFAAVCVFGKDVLKEKMKESSGNGK